MLIALQDAKQGKKEAGYVWLCVVVCLICIVKKRPEVLTPQVFSFF